MAFKILKLLVVRIMVAENAFFLYQTSLFPQGNFIRSQITWMKTFVNFFLYMQSIFVNLEQAFRNPRLHKIKVNFFVQLQ